MTTEARRNEISIICQTILGIFERIGEDDPRGPIYTARMAVALAQQCELICESAAERFSPEEFPFSKWALKSRKRAEEFQQMLEDTIHDLTP